MKKKTPTKKAAIKKRPIPRSQSHQFGRLRIPHDVRVVTFPQRDWNA